MSQNSVPVIDLPALIRSVHQAISTLGQAPAAAAAQEPLKPAVPIKTSITEDYIVSLEDGRKLKSMKRYLAGLGMTPAEYRAKWGLQADYPILAPAYAAHRSALAKNLGLGRRGVESVPAPTPEPEGAPKPDPEPAKPARKSKKAA